MSPLQQLKLKITEDFNEALRHIEWLEGYEKRLGGNGQVVMTSIQREAQTMPPAPPRSPLGDKSKAELIDDAIAAARDEFSVNEVIAFINAKYPGIEVGRKYVSFVLYKKEQAGVLEVSRKGIAGKPHYYKKRSSSGSKKSPQTKSA